MGNLFNIFSEGNIFTDGLNKERSFKSDKLIGLVLILLDLRDIEN